MRGRHGLVGPEGEEGEWEFEPVGVVGVEDVEGGLLRGHEAVRRAEG